VFFHLRKYEISCYMHFKATKYININYSIQTCPNISRFPLEKKFFSFHQTKIAIKLLYTKQFSTYLSFKIELLVNQLLAIRHILRSVRRSSIHNDTSLDFANAFVSPCVKSRAELVPSHHAPRRWLGDNLQKN
jgi:hypothetical protein